MACQRQTQVCSNLCPQDIVMESSECQSRSLTSGVLNNLESSQCPQCQDVLLTIGQCLTVSQNIQESLSTRYCRGQIGVPITFLDKWNPEQFKIIGFFNNYNPDTAGIGQIYGEAVTINSTTSLFRGPVINGKAKYFRIIVQNFL